MITKSVKKLIAEASADTESVSVAEALRAHGHAKVSFIDLRETEERVAEGTIPDTVHIPRGMLEFMIDPESPSHHGVFERGNRLIFFCGSGGRSALAAHVAGEMGVDHVQHLAGGFAAWLGAGGDVEPVV